MRKLILLTLIVSLICSSHTKAQDDVSTATTPPPKHEVYAGYGVLSLPVLFEAVLNIFGGEETTNRAFGPVQIGYNYLLSEKWSVGVLSSYTSSTSRYTRIWRAYLSPPLLLRHAPG